VTEVALVAAVSADYAGIVFGSEGTSLGTPLIVNAGGEPVDPSVFEVCLADTSRAVS